MSGARGSSEDPGGPLLLGTTPYSSGDPRPSAAGRDTQTMFPTGVELRPQSAVTCELDGSPQGGCRCEDMSAARRQAPRLYTRPPLPCPPGGGQWLANPPGFHLLT